METSSAQPLPEAQRIAVLEQQLAEATSERAAIAEKLRDAELSLQRLREAYTKALEQLALQHRRLFVAGSERRDDEGAQLAFESMVEQVRRLAEQLDAAATAACGLRQALTALMALTAVSRTRVTRAMLKSASAHRAGGAILPVPTSRLSASRSSMRPSKVSRRGSASKRVRDSDIAAAVRFAS